MTELRHGAPGLRSLTVSGPLSFRMAAGLPASLTRLDLWSGPDSPPIPSPQLNSLTNLQHLTLRGRKDKAINACLMPLSLTKLDGLENPCSVPDSAAQLSRLSNLQHLVLDSVYGRRAFSPVFLPHLPWLPSLQAETLVPSGFLYMESKAPGLLQQVFNHSRGLKHLTIAKNGPYLHRCSHISVLVHQPMISINLGCIADNNPVCTVIFKSLHQSLQCLMWEEALCCGTPQTRILLNCLRADVNWCDQQILRPPSAAFWTTYWLC